MFSLLFLSFYLNDAVIEFSVQFRGADPQAVDEQGKTPFQLAMESNFDDSEVLALLSNSHG